MKEQLRKWAFDLHQIPEIGLQEFKTTAYLINELKAMGYEPKQWTDTGCYVFIDQHKDQTIAFRSDIDALKANEESCHPYPSIHEGYMHACGHDGHMAMLLGLAKHIKGKELPYNILLIFQPAEEYPGGAELFCEKGLLEKYRVSAIFGYHLSPSINKGIIQTRPQAMMAQCGELNITINGKSAHAGLPHQGNDTLVVTSELILGYPKLLSKQISPTQTTLIHIGQVIGGTARNIVSEKTEMIGTIRVFSEAMFDELVHKMHVFHQGIESIYGCQIKMECKKMYPPVINDSKLTQQLFDKLNISLLEEPTMLAEDFSFYQKEVPGVFMFLGTKTDQDCYPLHSSHFHFDEDVLEIGVQAYLDIISKIKL